MPHSKPFIIITVNSIALLMVATCRTLSGKNHARTPPGGGNIRALDNA
jgi:hypothetical protein